MNDDLNALARKVRSLRENLQAAEDLAAEAYREKDSAQTLLHEAISEFDAAAAIAQGFKGSHG